MTDQTPEARTWENDRCGCCGQELEGQMVYVGRDGHWFTPDSLAAALDSHDATMMQSHPHFCDGRCAARIIDAAKEASVTDQTPEARSETSVWMVDFEVTAIEMHGHEWPDVLVQKWERNEMGERRFVESRIYKAAKEADRE